MLEEDKNTLKYDHRNKSLKAPFAIYADLECFLKKSNLVETILKCQICKEGFCDNKNKETEFTLYWKARDHCHYTGKFRGAANSICNLCYKVLKKFTYLFIIVLHMMIIL